MGTQAVYVLMETGGDGSPQRIQDDIDALPARQLGGRDEIRISSDEDDAIHEAFVCEGGDIETHLGVDPLLRYLVNDVVFAQMFHPKRPVEQAFRGAIANDPPIAISELPIAERNFSHAKQLPMQLRAKSKRSGLREVHALSGDRVVHFFGEGTAVVDEDPEQIVCRSADVCASGFAEVLGNSCSA